MAISLVQRIRKWKKEGLSSEQKVGLLSVVVGLVVGLAAVILKNAVHLTRNFVDFLLAEFHGTAFFILPLVGITITVLFILYIVRNPVRGGVASVLFAISKNQGKIKSHNIYSSLVGSALTVGFGGSVGLEGPAVLTGGAIGSNIGKWLKLSEKQVVLLIGCACASAMSSIFKAPIAAIIFVLEVIMLDLTMSALVPLLISSATAVLTSYFYMGQNYLYSFTVDAPFSFDQVGWYLVFGVFMGLNGVYFSKVYTFVHALFEKIPGLVLRLLTGGTLLGLLIYLFPSLYGEGYEVINLSLRGHYNFLFDNTIYMGLHGHFWATMLLFLLVLLFKAFATSVTFGAGGVGGIFAPSLFSGAIAGLFFSQLFLYFGKDLSSSSFALLGMAGMLSAVLHAPLTGMFLIAELTGGYQLFLALMIVTTTSYTTARFFVRNSILTVKLASRGELRTHHKDKAVLLMLRLNDLIETDFSILRPGQTMGELIETIKFAHRNIFPVVEEDGTFRGIIKFDDIRHIMFDTELYQSVHVRDLMFMPEHVILVHDSLEEVARKFQVSGRYNIAVLRHGKYLGFISRASLFSSYRAALKEDSEE